VTVAYAGVPARLRLAIVGRTFIAASLTLLYETAFKVRMMGTLLLTWSRGRGRTIERATRRVHRDHTHHLRVGAIPEKLP